MTMPAQKPGRSNQVVCTPLEFVRAVEAKLEVLFTFDAAASTENSITGANYYGPGSQWGEDALALPWDGLGDIWCNPPFGKIASKRGKPGFVEVAAGQATRGARSVLLLPAAVATNWFADHIDGNALVMPIRPRLTFVGHRNAFPKDLMICAFGFGRVGFRPWRWKP